jgi:hypothetical protein
MPICILIGMSFYAAQLMKLGLSDNSKEVNTVEESMSQDKNVIDPPKNTPEFMWGAWEACLRWAITNPDIRSQFEAETGHSPWPNPATPIETMIDKACGRDFEYLKSFADWHNKNIWGEV